MGPYDNYEKELIASLENNEWKSVEKAEKLRDQMQENAKAELQKRTRINLRHQALIVSILHKYANGKL